MDPALRIRLLTSFATSQSTSLRRASSVRRRTQNTFLHAQVTEGFVCRRVPRDSEDGHGAYYLP
jgi:hypothetical protein